jgi:hypothetical protein
LDEGVIELLPGDGEHAIAGLHAGDGLVDVAPSSKRFLA